MRPARRSGLVVAIAWVALAGCGGGERERERIAGVLTTGLTSRDPRVVCEGSLTPALLTRIYGGAARCRTVEGEPGERASQARSVDVSAIHVDGARATAVIAVHGGNHDGAHGALRLEHRAAGWRVSALSVALLRSQFEAGLRRLPGVAAAMKSCVARSMRLRPDADFERLSYGSDVAAHRVLTGVARGCAARIATVESTRL